MRDNRDLTPAEARAEVEAFLGSEWKVSQLGVGKGTGEAFVQCANGGVRVFETGPTYRAAVSALKAAWRDAVRPWCVRTVEEVDGCIDLDGNIVDQPAKIVRRVLKEDDK